MYKDCKYFSNNSYLPCAVDPYLNCETCKHYEKVFKKPDTFEQQLIKYFYINQREGFNGIYFLFKECLNNEVDNERLLIAKCGYVMRHNIIMDYFIYDLAHLNFTRNPDVDLELIKSNYHNYRFGLVHVYLTNVEMSFQMFCNDLTVPYTPPLLNINVVVENYKCLDFRDDCLQITNP